MVVCYGYIMCVEFLFCYNVEVDFFLVFFYWVRKMCDLCFVFLECSVVLLNCCDFIEVECFCIVLNLYFVLCLLVG